MQTKSYFFVIILLYLNIVLNWPKDGRSRPKHVAKYRVFQKDFNNLNLVYFTYQLSK